MVSALQDSKAPLPRPHPIVCMCHSAGPTRPSVCISFRGMGPHCPSGEGLLLYRAEALRLPTMYVRT